MALTQSLRREGTVISAVSSHRYSCKRSGRDTRRYPVCAQHGLTRHELCRAGATGAVPISFFLNQDDTVTVKVIDADGNAVRTLADRVPLDGNRRHCFGWDRRDDDGRRVRRTHFRLLVILEDADREAVAGEPVVLRRAPAREP